ncbi:MAG: putative prokaryotic signal transducing protein [Verrucomicrobiota bacterium]|jgi:hypothetical protein
MVTLRAFSNPAEAALAKSLLDDHNILCTLADENAYLYGGAPLAMPVRLLVAEDQAEEADRILKNPNRDCPDFEPNANNRLEETVETIAGDKLPTQQPAATNNPWEFLAIAALLLLPGLTLLLQKHELILLAPGRRISRHSITILSSSAAHVLGASVIAAALLLTILFFYTRRAITREQVTAALSREE